MTIVEKKRRAPMKRPEQDLQRSIARYLDAALPRTAIWFHVPNGGRRSKIEAAIFKGLGVKAGVPDIVIMHDRRAFCIELKAGNSTLTESQRHIRSKLQDAGIPVETVRSLDEARKALYGFGLPMRDVGVMA